MYEWLGEHGELYSQRLCSLWWRIQVVRGNSQLITTHSGRELIKSHKALLFQLILEIWIANISYIQYSLSMPMDNQKKTKAQTAHDTKPHSFLPT